MKYLPGTTCSVPDCSARPISKGLCRPHYMRQYKGSKGHANRLTLDLKLVIIDMLRTTQNCAAVTRLYLADYGMISLPTVCAIKRQAIADGDIERVLLKKELVRS